jgi:hypothetical protein
MKDSNESMTNNNVQEDRSMSTITRDAPPIIEVRRNSCQQLHIRVQPISHSCTYTPQSSTKSTTTWLQCSEAQAIIAHRARCTRWALAPLSGPWFNEWPDELDQNIFGSISANHARCTMIAHDDTLSGFNKYTRMSWIHPYNCLFTSIVSTSLTKL